VSFTGQQWFLIDPEGKIVKEWIGVDPSHHSEEVLSAIKELQHSNSAHAAVRDDTRP
jgi:peroxiredoxin